MRLLQLTPGTGSFLCGSCLRDNQLVTALRAQGHEAHIAPLYLPFALEEEPAAQGGAEVPVHMGGINVYLQQKAPVLRHLPRFVHDWLDAPRLLRWVARRSNMTGAAGLGALTLSMLRGESGRQQAELAQLVDWIAAEEHPDVVILSNALLLGLARELKRRLERPVLCTLQGEAPFLDALPEPYREQCWRELALRARDVDAFLPVSAYTGDLMRERLGLGEERVHVVWNGLDLSDIAPAGPPAGPTPGAPPGPPTVGYVARLCADKGLETLFEAFVLLKREVPDARLAAAGVVLGDDRLLVDRLRTRARALGFAEDVSFRADVSRSEKIALLRGLTAFSVPATYGESFGLYLLEAWAAGVPVVQPRHGGFPELLEATGGGLLCAPDDPAALAAALVELLSDPARARRLGERGRAAARDRFSAERMAEDVLRVCRMCAAGPP